MQVKRWAKRIVAAIVIAITGYFLIRNVLIWAQEVKSSGLSINFGLLALAVGITTVTSLFGGWGWVTLLRSLGCELAVCRGIKIQMTANLAKYIPGFAWQVLGKVYLSEQNGLPRRKAIVSVGAEFGVTIVTGGLLTLLALPTSTFFDMSTGTRTILQLTACALIVLILWLHPIASRWLIKRLGVSRRIPSLARLDWRHWQHAVLLILGNWVLFSVGFCFTVAAIWPIQLANVSSCFVTLTASFIFSLLVVVVPSGLGIRELSVGILLGQFMPLPTASVIAIAARLTLVVSELLGFLIISRYYPSPLISKEN